MKTKIFIVVSVIALSYWLNVITDNLILLGLIVVFILMEILLARTRRKIRQIQAEHKALCQKHGIPFPDYLYEKTPYNRDLLTRYLKNQSIWDK